MKHDGRDGGAGRGAARGEGGEWMELPVDLAQQFPLLLHIRFLHQHLPGPDGEFHRKQFGKTITGAVSRTGLAAHAIQFVGLLQDLAGRLAEALEMEPIQVAVLFPIREVLGTDGPVLELFLEDLAHGGVLVEPVEDFGAGLAVFDAAAQFVADVGGQAPDFTDVGGHIMNEE